MTTSWHDFPAEMNDFRSQLTELLTTLHKLPDKEQEAALGLLQNAVSHQLHDSHLPKEESKYDTNPGNTDCQGLSAEAKFTKELAFTGLEHKSCEGKVLHPQQIAMSEEHSGLIPSFAGDQETGPMHESHVGHHTFQDKLPFDIFHQLSESKDLEAQALPNDPKLLMLHPLKPQDPAQVSQALSLIDRGQDLDVVDLRASEIPECGKIVGYPGSELKKGDEGHGSGKGCSSVVTHMDVIHQCKEQCPDCQNLRVAEMCHQEEYHMDTDGSYTGALRLERATEGQQPVVDILTEEEQQDIAKGLTMSDQEAQEFSNILGSETHIKLSTLQKPYISQEESGGQEIAKRGQEENISSISYDKGVITEVENHNVYTATDLNAVDKNTDIYSAENSYMILGLGRGNFEESDYNKSSTMSGRDVEEHMQETLATSYPGDLGYGEVQGKGESDLNKSPVDLSSASQLTAAEPHPQEQAANILHVSRDSGALSSQKCRKAKYRQRKRVVKRSVILRKQSRFNAEARAEKHGDDKQDHEAHGVEGGGSGDTTSQQSDCGAPPSVDTGLPPTTHPGQEAPDEHSLEAPKEGCSSGEDLTNADQQMNPENNLQLQPVSCKSCSKQLPDISLLSSHLYQCRGHLFCKMCKAKFVRKVTFLQHMAGHARNVCLKCDQSYCSVKKLKLHMKMNHNVELTSKEYPCQTCSKRFLKRSSLYYHYKTHAAEDEHVCQKCGMFCKGTENYKVHMENHAQATKWHCSICAAYFTRRQQYTDHLKNHRKNKCQICGKPFTTKKDLVRHCRAEHNTLPKNITLDQEYMCDLCQRTFKRPSLLHDHQMIHKGIAPLECRPCNKQFSQRRGLRKHLNSVNHVKVVQSSNMQKDHAYDLKQYFSCEYCGIIVTSEYLLVKHCKQVHRVGVTRHCPHCNYKTNRNHTLKRHMELHVENRKFVCEICGRSFQARATLKDHHSFVHSDERNHKCDHCEKSFKNKSSLVRHLRSHSDDRPYKCHCGTDYKRLSHLKRHTLSVHKSSLGSRAVKKLKSIEENLKLPNSKQHLEKVGSNPNAGDFEFVSFSGSLPGDATIPPHESVILMGDNSNSEESQLITVGDSQVIHLIPSTFQYSEDGSLQAVSLVPTSDPLQPLPLSGTSFDHNPDGNQMVVEPSAITQNSAPVVMIPSSQEHTHLADNEAINTTLGNFEAESLTESHMGSNTKPDGKDITLHKLESPAELPVAPGLESYDYMVPTSSQTLLSSFPPQHYITRSHNANTQLYEDIVLQQNFMCPDFVLPVGEDR